MNLRFIAETSYTLGQTDAVYSGPWKGCMEGSVSLQGR